MNLTRTPDAESASLEKSKVVQTEYPASSWMSADDLDFLSNFSEEKRKKVMRKVDYKLIPLLLLLYLVAYIDKTNIGNAKIEGLTKSLHLDGIKYNIALSVFFIPYVLAEVPSNMILNYFNRPSLYLGVLIFIWGVIMTCTGFTHNFAGLVVIRFLLGLFEAGFFPGAILIISQWYLPEETQTRIALLYSSAATGGAFSGLLAYAIAKMHGLGGYEGWRWIFIIEGIATVAMAFLCFFCLPDGPGKSGKWLEPEEIRYLELRQLSRRASKPGQYREKAFDRKALVAVLLDWKIYLLVLANWSNAIPNYALKFTMPQIIKNMGFTSAKAQLLTIPPYAVGAFSAFGFSYYADRYTWRMPFIVAPQLSLVAAFSILFTKAADIKHNIPLCYFAVCLACFGMYPIFSGVQTWNIANLAGANKRAIGIGYLVCAGNIGGVIGSYIYIDKEAPKYPTGFGTSFAVASAGILACFTLEYLLHRSNKKNAKFTEDEIREKYTPDELEAMGDKSPLFKYSL